MIALGLHSHCSLMRGTASPRALCRRVRQLGYTAAALTDTNNLYGLWPFLAACADEGLTPVIGAELRSTTGRLFALVRDRVGFRHLCRLLTAVHADPALDLGQALADHHAGLLLLVPEPDLLRRCRDLGAETMAALVDRPCAATSRLRREARRLGLPAVAQSNRFFPMRTISPPTGCCAPSTPTPRSPGWTRPPWPHRTPACPRRPSWPRALPSGPRASPRLHMSPKPAPCAPRATGSSCRPGRAAMR